MNIHNCRINTGSEDWIFFVNLDPAETVQTDTASQGSKLNSSHQFQALYQQETGL